MIKYLVSKNGYQETREYSDDVWVNVTTPNRRDIAILENEFGVPLSFINDIEDNEERPRVEYEDDWRMIIIRVPIKLKEEGDFFGTAPLGILTSGEKFITICHHEAEMIEDLVYFSRRKSFQRKNANDLILHLMLSSSVWYMKYLKRLNAEIKDGEKNLQKSIRNEELLEMMRIERTLVHFITSLRGNELLLQKFKSALPKTNKPFDDDLLEDVEIEMQQARVTANVHSDILTGMMDAFAAVISNNVNVIMKRLTSFSIVLMFPTLIASYFGMNLEKTSEIWTPEFYLVIAGSVLLSILGVWFFKKKNWL
ncbi:MAG: magnesium transporter CorA family protein [Bacteroidales bacterium]|nr:magnesium transporter CorA family protein [Bacteroidales bacterium]MCL2133915.1 magnesium transporter CorA family protein [Bacteroidales bacterium]